MIGSILQKTSGEDLNETKVILLAISMLSPAPRRRRQKDHFDQHDKEVSSRNLQREAGRPRRGYQLNLLPRAVHSGAISVELRHAGQAHRFAFLGCTIADRDNATVVAWAVPQPERGFRWPLNRWAVSFLSGRYLAGASPDGSSKGQDIPAPESAKEPRRFRREWPRSTSELFVHANT